MNPNHCPFWLHYHVGCSLRTLQRSQILGFLVKSHVFTFCLLGWLGHLQCEMYGHLPCQFSMLSFPGFNFNVEPQPSCNYVCIYVIYEYEVGFKVTRVVHTNALLDSELELALQLFDSIPSAPELCLAVKNPALLQHKPAAVSGACLAWHTPACLAWVQHRPFWIKIVICLLTGVHSSFHSLQNHRPFFSF